jgi:hypothetical protein
MCYGWKLGKLPRAANEGLASRNEYHWPMLIQSYSIVAIIPLALLSLLSLHALLVQLLHSIAEWSPTGQNIHSRSPNIFVEKPTIKTCAT